ncbi:MAG: hypothetical protein LBT27_01330 [Prevotellaceae bacterium]|jgi:hypothetical protein|nr:hypothetical protein [Prevotellaceae bacterium]
MKKTIFILLISVGFLSCVKNQPVVNASLIVDVISENQADTSLFMLTPNIFKINQIFYLRNYLQDTILFSLEIPSPNASWLNVIFFQKIKVFSIAKQKKDSIYFEFSEKGIKCAVPSKNCTLEIEYYYMPDYVMFGDSGTLSASVMRVAASWQSWYFTVPNVKFKDIQFTVPDNKKFFVSLPQKIKNNKIYLDCSNIPQYGVTFLVVNPSYYQNFNIGIGKSNFNIFAFKDINITNDSTFFERLYVPKDTVLNTENYAKYLLPLENIEKIFSKNIRADIIDGNISIQNAKMGQAFPVEKNNGFLFMDTACWRDAIGLHEIIHLYNNIMPEKRDSAHYFFNEVMTEFLSTYFYYSIPEKRDSVFLAKITDYNKNYTAKVTIFEIKKNEILMKIDSKSRQLLGSYGPVYQKTPYKLYMFAKDIGEEKFFNLLTLFYKNVKKKNVCTFFDFEKTMKQNGVSDQQWNDFIKDL